MKLGKTVMTRRIANLIDKNENFSKDIIKALRRYINKDWGELCQDDKEANDLALKTNDRLLATYNTVEGKIYIITEWDRSYTTILFPDEY